MSTLARLLGLLWLFTTVLVVVVGALTIAWDYIRERRGR